jgi:lysophospholipase L1-like esterase
MRLRRAAAVVLYSVGVVLLGLIALELSGRAYMHLRYGEPGKRYGRWRGDPVLGSRMAENRYDHRWSTNDRGFRDDEDLLEPKPAGAWRIIAYGGSTTLCWNLPTPETWPAQLERILRERTGDARHQVLNAGDILWSIGRIYARASREVPAHRPDFVLLYTGVNEDANADLLAASGRPMESLVRSGRYGVFSRRLPQDSWLARNSIVFALAQKSLALPAARWWRAATHEKWSVLRLTPVDSLHPPVPPDSFVLRNYLHVLSDMIVLCRRNDAAPIFVIEATGLRTQALDRATAYSREGAVLARRMNVPVVDAQAMVDAYAGDPMDLFYASGIHYSAKGARLLAERLADEILAQGALRR